MIKIRTEGNHGVMETTSGSWTQAASIRESRMYLSLIKTISFYGTVMQREMKEEK